MNYMANYISVGNQEFGRTGPFQFVPTDFDMKAADFLALPFDFDCMSSLLKAE